MSLATSITLLVRPYVVYLPQLALVQNNVVGGRDVVHVQEAPHVLPSAVNRQFLPVAAQENELGHELLWELVGAVNVVPSGRDARQVVGLVVGGDHHLRARLGRR